MECQCLLVPDTGTLDVTEVPCNGAEIVAGDSDSSRVTLIPAQGQSFFE